jgi:hypothetical protein
MPWIPTTQEVVQTAGDGELGYVQTATLVTVSATSEATPDIVVTLPDYNYDGSTTVMFHFFCPAAACNFASGAAVIVNLWDGAADLGRMLVFSSPAGGSSFEQPIDGWLKVTPTAGVHSYSARAFRAVANATLDGSPPRVPTFLRATTTSAATSSGAGELGFVMVGYN